MGYNHIMVATDAATKYVILMKIVGYTAEAATELLLEISRRF